MLKNQKKVKEFLDKLKITTEVYEDRSKEEILDGIGQGAKEAAEYLQGKRKLRSAKEFLNEL